MTPTGIALTALFTLAVLLLPRQRAAVGVMAAVCYITQGQQYIVADLHMHAIRIVLLAGLIRLVVRGEFRELKLNKIDWALMAYAGAMFLIPSLRERTSEELVYRLGCAYDILMSFWVFRGLLKDWEEVEKFLQGLAILIVPLALEMVFEMVTHRSMFESFGGIGDLTIREGRPRCQGAFRLGITAGVFGATLLPLFISLYHSKTRRPTVIVGLLSAAVITYTSNSSGPLMAALSGVVAWLFWPLRMEMRKVRWGIVLVLLFLQLSMKAPVWFIFSKLGALTGGDGWHRSYLIDRFFHFFPDWWLMGTKHTGNWMPYTLLDGNADITNFYIASGIAGGLLALILSIILLVRCFRYLGLAMIILRTQSSEVKILVWGFGSALFAHVVTLFSVTYFDQVYVALWSLLAIISSTTSRILQGEPAADSMLETQEISPEVENEEQGLGPLDGLPEGDVR
jgi:hypothetical protein